MVQYNTNELEYTLDLVCCQRVDVDGSSRKRSRGRDVDVNTREARNAKLWSIITSYESYFMYSVIMYYNYMDLAMTEADVTHSVSRE